MSLIIKGGRIIDPDRGVDLVGDLWVEGGVVKALEERLEAPPQARVIDATGLVVCHGFIDVHCHLREPGDDDKETIESGTAAAARGGFTTVCAMPNTRPPIDSPQMVGFVLDRAGEKGMVRALPIACVTEGREGRSLARMEELAQAGAVAFSDDGSPVADDGLMRQALIKSAALGLPIINHCEDPGISSGGVMNEGLLAAGLGLKGWPVLAEETMAARDVALAEATGGRLHLAHLSAAGSVDIVRRAKERGLNVTAEATPHHLTITEDWVRPGAGQEAPANTAAKVNPPLRTDRDVAAVVQGLKEGVIDCIATDHAPHTHSDKSCSFQEAAFGISGLEVALGSLMSLVHAGKLDMSALVERLTTGPARVLGLRGPFHAALKPGAPADVVVFDPNAEWVVDTSKFVSRGRNTPLDGATLRGMVVATMVAGRVVYESEAAQNG